MCTAYRMAPKVRGHVRHRQPPRTLCPPLHLDIWMHQDVMGRYVPSFLPNDVTREQGYQSRGQAVAQKAKWLVAGAPPGAALQDRALERLLQAR